MGGVVPPVTTSSLDVEAPLLAGPLGSVVTLLNWAERPFNSSTGLITVNATLGFVPSRAESVLHGPLHPTPIAGHGAAAVTVTLPLDAADFLLFYK